MTAKEILQCTAKTELLLVACPPQVLFWRARSHSRVVMMVVDDSDDESAIAVFSNVP